MILASHLSMVYGRSLKNRGWAPFEVHISKIYHCSAFGHLGKPKAYRIEHSGGQMSPQNILWSQSMASKFNEEQTTGVGLFYPHDIFSYNRNIKLNNDIKCN